MNIKKKVGALFLVFSLGILLFENRPLITSYAISNTFNASALNFLGLILLIGSLILLITNKKSLDYLVIPDGDGKYKKQKLERALEEKSKRNIGEIYVLKGRDSEEDILILGEKLKPGDRVGFDTFLFHYQEYRELIKKAIRDKKFPKRVKIENIKTKQTLKQTIYGVFGLTEEIVKRRKLDYLKNRDEKYYQKLKNFVKNILS